MNKDFILLMMSQHYPHPQQFQLLSRKDLFSLEPDVADFLKSTEQEISNRVLNNIYAYASSANHNG